MKTLTDNGTKKRGAYKLRKVQGFSQEDLSYEADIPLSQVGRIERGEINPTISTLGAIASALHVELKELFNFKY